MSGKPRVLVVGASGMLGSALTSLLARNASVEVYGTFRTPWLERLAIDGVDWIHFQAGNSLPPKVQLGAQDWIVNAAGAIPQRDDHEGDAGMVRVNALLPYELAELCKGGARMIHVTTDCVFSGQTAPGRTSLNSYKEHDAHDAHTLYARSKSLGEVRGNRRVFNLRCSIVGPEPRSSRSLMGWFLSSKKPVVGYGDHLWNGVTTLALSKVIEGMILYSESSDVADLPSVQHLVPKDHVSKAQLLEAFARAFDVPTKVDVANVGGVDRTLGTVRPELNNRLWVLAGYETPPTIEEMVQELARWVGAGNYLFGKEVQA